MPRLQEANPGDSCTCSLANHLAIAVVGGGGGGGFISGQVRTTASMSQAAGDQWVQFIFPAADSSGPLDI